MGFSTVQCRQISSGILWKLWCLFCRSEVLHLWQTCRASEHKMTFWVERFNPLSYAMKTVNAQEAGLGFKLWPQNSYSYLATVDHNLPRSSVTLLILVKSQISKWPLHIVFNINWVSKNTMVCEEEEIVQVSVLG